MLKNGPELPILMIRDREWGLAAVVPQVRVLKLQKTLHTSRKTEQVVVPEVEQVQVVEPLVQVMDPALLVRVQQVVVQDRELLRVLVMEADRVQQVVAPVQALQVQAQDQAQVMVLVQVLDQLVVEQVRPVLMEQDQVQDQLVVVQVLQLTDQVHQVEQVRPVEQDRLLMVVAQVQQEAVEQVLHQPMVREVCRKILPKINRVQGHQIMVPELVLVRLLLTDQAQQVRVEQVLLQLTEPEVHRKIQPKIKISPVQVHLVTELVLVQEPELELEQKFMNRDLIQL